MQGDKFQAGLSRRARRLRWLLTGLLLLAALFITASLYGGLAVLLGFESGIAPSSLRFGRVDWPGWCSLLLSGLAVLAGLWRLTHMLKCIESGRIFSAEIAADLRAFAACLLAATLFWTFVPPLAGLAMTLFGRATGHPMLAVDGSQLLMLLVTGVLFLVARLLEAAQRMADDYRQII